LVRKYHHQLLGDKFFEGEKSPKYYFELLFDDALVENVDMEVSFEEFILF
jgi:hypothetical protein